MIFNDKKIKGEIDELRQRVNGLRSALASAKDNNKELKKRLYDLENKLATEISFRKDLDERLKAVEVASAQAPKEGLVFELTSEVMSEWLYKPRNDRGRRL